jgi:uncharacterized protein YlxW (UPF0749 family)
MTDRREPENRRPATPSDEVASDEVLPGEGLRGEAAPGPAAPGPVPAGPVPAGSPLAPADPGPAGTVASAGASGTAESGAAAPDEETRPLDRPSAEVTQNLDEEPTVEQGRPGADDSSGPDRVVGGDGDAAAGDDRDPVRETAVPGTGKPRKKVTSAGALIWVLLLLLGYTLVVQLRSNNDDQGLATARQEDLVSILSDLESRDSRLQTEIQSLESSQRQLTSGVSSRQAALAEAEKRAGELGLLAGTLPGKGPGLKITIDRVKASEILNAVQELRGSGGEVMELVGAEGTAVRIVASSYFVDAQGGGIDADGSRLTGPWTLWVIGSPQTMQTALQIQGGVVASINGAGGSVTMEAQPMVEVTAVRKPGSLQYAKPAS